MLTSLQPKSKIFYQASDCLLKHSKFNHIFNCSFVLYDNKMIQFHYSSQNDLIETCPQNHHLNMTTKTIKLDLTYSVHILSQKIYPNVQTDKLSFNMCLFIKNIHSGQQFKIKWLSQHQILLRSYFQNTTWIVEKLQQKYQVVREINEKNTKNQRNFLLMKNLDTFENHFAKKYESKNFINEKTKQLDISSIVREVYFQNLLKHENVMFFNEFITDQNNFFLFYEEKPSKILSQYNKVSHHISHNRIKKIMCQLFRVLQQFQSLQILHNNIRLSSVFIIGDNNDWKISLGEFQFAHFIKDDIPQKRLDRNKYFLAPELIQQNVFYGHFIDFSDIFSLGILFYEILFRKELFYIQMANQRVKNVPIQLQTYALQGISGHYLDLLSEMLKFDPGYRISPAQALQHNYFIMQESLTQDQSFMLQSFVFSSQQSQMFDSATQILKIMNSERQINRLVELYMRQSGPHKRSDCVNEKQLKSKKRRYSPYHRRRLECNYESIDEREMDDSHTNILVRDIRMMRPAWKLHQM